MSEWRSRRLGDICELKRGYDLPAADRNPGHVPIVSSSGVTGYHSEAKVAAPGVVTGRYGTLGQVFYIAEDFWPLNTALYVRDFKGNEPRFVAALLESLELGRNSGAAAVPGINRNQLHTLEVRCPDLRTQRSVASILEAIDALIDNNRRRAETLDQLVRLIYREWFVHFRFPGHAEVTLVESDFHLIPEGWSAAPIGDLLSFHIGGGWGQEQPTDDEPHSAAVIRGTDIPGARTVDVASCPVRYHNTEAARKRLLQPGDVVLEVSGGSKDQPVGRSLLISDFLLSEFGGPAICASFCKLLRFRSGVEPAIVYLALRDLYDSGAVYEYQVQSTGISNLQFKAFLAGFQLQVPPQALQAHFVALASPLTELGQTLGARNRCLREVRKLLLPKLVTGQIDASMLDLDVDAIVVKAGA